MRADERLTPSSGPKSMRSFQAGLRASGKSSTPTTRPTRMSTATKSSKEISPMGRTLTVALVLVLAGRRAVGRRSLLLVLGRGLCLLAGGRRLRLVVGGGRRLGGRDRLDRLAGADRPAMTAVVGRQHRGVGLLLGGRRRGRGGLRGVGGGRRRGHGRGRRPRPLRARGLLPRPPWPLFRGRA